MTKLEKLLEEAHDPLNSLDHLGILLREFAASQPGEPGKARCPNCGSNDLSLAKMRFVQVRCNTCATTWSRVESVTDFAQFFHPSAPSPQAWWEQNKHIFTTPQMRGLAVDFIPTVLEHFAADSKFSAPSGSAGPEEVPEDLVREYLDSISSPEIIAHHHGEAITEFVNWLNDYFIVMCKPDPPAESAAGACPCGDTGCTGHSPAEPAVAKGPTIDEQIASLQNKRDEDIDTSDIPEVKDWSGAVVGKFYRQPEPAIVSASPACNEVIRHLESCKKCAESAAQPVAADPKVEEDKATEAAYTLHRQLRTEDRIFYDPEKFAAILGPFFTQVSQPPMEDHELGDPLWPIYQKFIENAPKPLPTYSGWLRTVAANLEKLAAVAPVSGNGTEPRDTESEFRAWMAKHSTTDYIGGELRSRAAVEFAESYTSQLRAEKEYWNKQSLKEYARAQDAEKKLAGAASHNGQGWDEMNKAGWLLYRSLLSMRCCSELKEEPDADECKSMGVAMKAWEASTGEKFQEKFALSAPPSEADGPAKEGTK